MRRLCLWYAWRHAVKTPFLGLRGGFKAPPDVVRLSRRSYEHAFAFMSIKAAATAATPALQDGVFGPLEVVKK